MNDDMNNDKIETLFRAVISADENTRQRLLKSLSPTERHAVEQLVAADESAEKQGLFESLHRDDSNTAMLKADTRIRNYEIGKVIGTGGMGTVFMARHTRLRCDVALKILPIQNLPDAATVARFEQEMMAVGQLRHPNIVQATDAGEENGIHYLALEYVKGADLSTILGANSQISVPDACEVVRQTALGLAHAHDRGLVHRDIKPSNLLVSFDGVVKIADLGLAMLHFDHGDLTSSGQLMGTLDYIAPEQIENPRSVTPAADMYSLGCTFFHILCGTAPFATQDGPFAKIRAHSSIQPPQIETYRDDVPVTISEIVTRLMAKNPEERLSSAAILAEELNPHVAGACVESIVQLATQQKELAPSTNRMSESATLRNAKPDILPGKEPIVSSDRQTARTTGSVAAAPRRFGRKAVIGFVIGLGMLAAALKLPSLIRTATSTAIIDETSTSQRGESTHTRGTSAVDGRSSSTENTVPNPLADVDSQSTTKNSKRPALESLFQMGIGNVGGLDDHGTWFYARKPAELPLAADLERPSHIEMAIINTSENPTIIEDALTEVASSQLPLRVLMLWGQSPSAEAFRLMAAQQQLTNLRLFDPIDLRNLAEVPAGSLDQVETLLFSGPTKMSVASARLVVDRFPNVNRLSLRSWDFAGIAELDRLPLLHVSLTRSQSEPNLDQLQRFTSVETVYLVFSRLLTDEPKLDVASLPAQIRSLEVHNATLAPNNLEQLKAYPELAEVTLRFADNLAREPSPLDEKALADFKSARPEIRVRITDTTPE